MSRFIICSFVAGALVVGASDFVHAKKPVQTDAQKALQEIYPDAKTEITGTRDVNGVKVNDVKVTTKDGESTAQVTENGDFLMYGMPRADKTFTNMLASAGQGVFKDKPKDIDVYRVTNYYVDLMGPDNKYFRARFDAVGRLKDIASGEKLTSEGVGSMEKASKDNTGKAEAAAKKYLPDAQVEGVYNAKGSEGFYYVDIKGGDMVVNPTDGRVYSYREEIKKEELPKPVMTTVEAMFNPEHIKKAYRGEYEYYQFDQATPAGDAVVVKMRPNGDIVEIRNEAASADDAAMTAAAKQKATPAQVGPEPTAPKAKKKAK